VRKLAALFFFTVYTSSDSRETCVIFSDLIFCPYTVERSSTPPLRFIVACRCARCGCAWLLGCKKAQARIAFELKMRDVWTQWL